MLGHEVATKNRFFGIVAHDLRSPFTSLLGLTELIVRGAETRPRADLRDLATHVRDSARHLHTLLEQLLEWAGLQMGSTAPHPTDVDVGRIAVEILAQYADSAGTKGVHLASRVPADLRVHADPDMLRAVLRNLVANAIKFTSSGDRVWIEAAPAPDGATVTLAVHDTGVGLDPAQSAHLFDVAVKTTAPGTAGERGTGLGLPLCAEMVRLNGGRIEAEPGPDGVGTTLRVTLPARAGSHSSSGTDREKTE
nr:HAMP domain-containing sensor histidine kinase [Roseospira navarrensis]